MCDEYGDDDENYPATAYEAQQALDYLMNKPKVSTLGDLVPVFCAFCNRKWFEPKGWANARKPEEIFCNSGCQVEYEKRQNTQPAF
jgi:hypothetical protein